MIVPNIDDCPNGPARVHQWTAEGVCDACGGELPTRQVQFAQRLEQLINRHCMEAASDTPDFILAQYLLACLANWNTCVRLREQWSGRPSKVLTAKDGPACL